MNLFKTIAAMFAKKVEPIEIPIVPEIKDTPKTKEDRVPRHIIHNMTKEEYIAFKARHGVKAKYSGRRKKWYFTPLAQ